MYQSIVSPHKCAPNFTPQLGGIWHSDEMMQNVRNTEPIKVSHKGEEGNYLWMCNLMDQKIRFVLASQITKHRDIEDAKKVLRGAKEMANGQVPDFIVTDKLHAYNEAIKKESYTNTNPKTKRVKLKNIKEGIRFYNKRWFELTRRNL